MYIPKLYRESDRSFLLEFMQRHSFATLVSTRDGVPQATHLPFVAEEREGRILLSTHMAKANPQWKDFSEGKVLVIFQEPHGYVSPEHYEHEQNVPTWNYIAVHAYGQAKPLPAKKDRIEILEKMFAAYEEGFRSRWESLPENYREGLLHGIVAFTVEVEELQGKQKVSQNKSPGERENIIRHFGESSVPGEHSMADYMAKYPYRK